MRPLLNAETLALQSPGIIVRAAELAEAQLWAETDLIDIMSCWVHSSHGSCYFGTIDGQVAAGAALTIHDGVALLGGASTLPAFRNRGLQSALLQARLAHAAAAGCDLAMTVTLPGSGSQHNCEKLGFRVAYTRAKFILP